MASSPSTSRLSPEDVPVLLEKLSLLEKEIEKVIVGQREPVRRMLTALLAGGHCLLEGVPGLAKTLMVRTLAEALHLDFRRIQFTPDLMPSDVVGTEILEENRGTGKRVLQFNRGPVFTNLLLADEINRTPPKTQSALLEAMQEGAVTYAGNTYPLERPFFVLATQNPIEQAGTYPLPEAQLDRFLLYVRVDYPSREEERRILEATTGAGLPAARAVLGAAEILELQQLVRQVTVSEALVDYVADLARASRPEDSPVAFVRDWVRWGAGPRAGQAMILTAKALALLEGRFAVTLPDLREVALPVFRHRILVNFKAEAEGIDADQVTETLLEQVPEPRSPLE